MKKKSSDKSLMKRFESRNWLIILSLIGFLLIICLYYVVHKPFDGGLVYKSSCNLKYLFISIVMVILAGGLGKCLLGILKVDQNRPVVSMALGLGCLSLVFLMIAWIFGISVWWGWGILVALFIGLFRNIHAWVLEMVHMNKDIWHRSEPLGKMDFACSFC